MDGVLLIDKPSGPTSHDVVARIRSASRERSVGHTGTLDPAATGLMVLVLGRATRLASLLTAGDKTYEAAIRLGFATDTDDATGRPLAGAVSTPSDEAIGDALAGFRGEIHQTPPSHSAKKVGGEKAYELARRSQPVELKPVLCTVRTLDLVGRDGDLVHIRVTASAGFYVRALARDLGARLGCGGHLASLRRTRSGPFDLSGALPLAEAERMGPGVASHLLTPADALAYLPSVRLTDGGLTRACHGNPVGPEHLVDRAVPPGAPGMRVRLLGGEDGRLVALAASRGGALHPVVVLG